MSIQEIINAITILINMITNGLLAKAIVTAEKAKAELRSAAERREKASHAFYEIRWFAIFNQYNDLLDQLLSWQSETLKGLWKSYWASETFCRKTLGEIKRLTHLAEDQERSRKGDPALAASYRAQVERLRAERAKALEVMAKKEAKTKARATSAEEAAEKAKAIAKIEAEIQKLQAENSSRFEEYFKLKAELEAADEALDAAMKAEEEAQDQLRIARRMIERLEDLKSDAEEAIEAAETAEDDWDLNRAIRLENKVKDIFESDWFEKYLEIAA